MDVFSKLNKLDDSKLHPKFKVLRDEFFYRGAKSVVEEFSKGFVDRDNKFVREFQTTFHSSLWELYLNAIFKYFKLEIDYSYSRPDFIIKNENTFYVEAVVSQIKKGGVDESNRTLVDQLKMLQPISSRKEFTEIIDEAISRHSNSIISKLKKYDDYKLCEWVDESKPYVVALASYDQINYGKEYHYSMLALLYGLYYCPESKRFNKLSTIKKPDTDADLPLGFFLDEKYKNISAIIFSCTLSLGKLSSLNKSKCIDPNFIINIRQDDEIPFYKIHVVSENNPEDLADGLFVFHNPFAKNKLPYDTFDKSNVMQYRYEKNKLTTEGYQTPLVARYATPNALTPEPLKKIIIQTAFSNYNVGCEGQDLYRAFS